MKISQTLFGKTTRGQIVRLGAISLLLWCDLDTPGYMKFSNPLKLLVPYSLTNALSCPKTEVLAIPPMIPGLAELSSKRATEVDLIRKFGEPVCRKDGDLYFKLPMKNYLAVKVAPKGEIQGFKVYR